MPEKDFPENGTFQKKFSSDPEAKSNVVGFFELLMEIDREQKLLSQTDD